VLDERIVVPCLHFDVKWLDGYESVELRNQHESIYPVSSCCGCEVWKYSGRWKKRDARCIPSRSSNLNAQCRGLLERVNLYGLACTSTLDYQTISLGINAVPALPRKAGRVRLLNQSNCTMRQDALTVVERDKTMRETARPGECNCNGDQSPAIFFSSRDADSRLVSRRTPFGFTALPGRIIAAAGIAAWALSVRVGPWDWNCPEEVLCGSERRDVPGSLWQSSKPGSARP